jgi:hypothetical protein
MKNKTKGLLFQLPGIIILALAIVGSFIVKIKNMFPIRWPTPITLLVIGILYFIGIYFSMKEDNPYY